jgi:uncharacterized protein YecE (DUF72 family)
MPFTRRILIGTSGFDYRHWRDGVFYPEGLARDEQLGFYAARFPTVELNAPFYRLPARETFSRWADRTPGDFLFAVKASRYISHVKRLRDCEESTQTFLERAGGLGARLAVVLCQLPPTLREDRERLDGFLRTLPEGPPWVFEFRHPSWLTESTLDLLRAYDAGFCVPVGGPRLPVDAVAATGPVAYVRMHRGRGTDGAFTPAELREWAERILELAEEGRTTYVYFNNDRQGFAPLNALELMELLGVPR